MKIKISTTMSLLLTAALLALAGCTADDVRIVDSPQEADAVALAIEVAEDGWQGDNGQTSQSDWLNENIGVTVTRSGETIDGLKATSAKSWDFTTLADKDALLALEGLSLPGNVEVVSIDDAKAVQLNDLLTISDLKAGQTVKITYKSVSSGALTTTNLNGSFASSTEKTTQEGTVTADGDVTFTGYIYIYAISVSVADTDGFGLYGWELLGPSQRHVTWSSGEGRWNSGNYVYWKRIPNDENIFRVYAYAPHKTAYNFIEETSGYIFNLPFTSEPLTEKDPSDDATPTGKITFKADKDGRNIDLLYAGAEVKRSDGVARLTFRHALAKMSFGTIANNTGGSLTLTGLTVKGKMHSVAQVDLMTGTWAPTTSADAVIHRDPASPGLEMANRAIVDLNQEPILLIPGSDGKIEVTVTLTSDGSTFEFTTVLEEGRDKTYNITVEKNFEVVIEN